jgi:hypothetical protein
MKRFRKGLGILLAAALSIAPASAFYAQDDTANAAAIDKEAFVVPDYFSSEEEMEKVYTPVHSPSTTRQEALAKKKNVGNAQELKESIVSKRTILNFSLDNFSLTKVVNTLNALKAGGIAVAGVVLDGIDFAKVSEDDIKAVADYAKKENVTVWGASTADGTKLADSVPAALEGYFSAVPDLNQKADAVSVDVLKIHDKKNVEAGLKLDTKTLLITKA